MPSHPDAAFRFIRHEDLARAETTRFRCGDEPWEDKVAQFLKSGEAWVEHLDNKTQTLLWCDEQGEGRIVGYANVVKTKIGYPQFGRKPKIPCLLIAWIAVDSQHQGDGHSSAMLEKLTQMAIEQDLQALYLLVDERNIRAINIYKKRGFQTFADAEPWIDREDDSRNVRMILPLFNNPAV